MLLLMAKSIMFSIMALLLMQAMLLLCKAIFYCNPIMVMWLTIMTLRPLAPIALIMIISIKTKTSPPAASPCPLSMARSSTMLTLKLARM